MMLKAGGMGLMALAIAGTATAKSVIEGVQNLNELFVYSQQPRNKVFAAPNEARIREIAAHLPEKPGWYTHFDCSESMIKTALSTELPKLAAEDYLRVFEDGNRAAYEGKFGKYHTALDRLTAATVKLIDTGDPRRTEALKRLEAVLEFYVAWPSWVSPAHDPGKGKVWRGELNRIDLYSSVISASLANVLLKLSGELPPELVVKVRNELWRRTLNSYLNSSLLTTNPKDDKKDNNHWFYICDNWNTVCHCFSVAAALAAIDDRETRARFIEAAERAMPYYLSGFYADGYCFEGGGYWDYGYGNFLRLAAIVRKATGGFVDFTKLPRAKAMAAYGFTSQMDASTRRPLFADSGNNKSSPQWLDFCIDFWPEMKSYRQKALPPQTFFPLAQVYIGRGHDFAFALKGGQNNLPHCHRDLGTWNLITNGVFIAGDVGSEKYNLNTFSAKRFDSKMNNSYGHPVPRVNGELQTGGAEAFAKILKADFEDNLDTIVLDITSGYKCLRNGKGKLIRTMTFDRGHGKVTIRDDFSAKEPMTFDSPVIYPGKTNPLVATAEGGKWKLVDDTFENPGRSPSRQYRQSVSFEEKVTSATVTWSWTRPETPKTTLTEPMALAKLVADSYLKRKPYETNKYALWWDWATLWWGVTKLGLADRSAPYLDFMVKFGDYFKWDWMRSEPVGYHADSQCIGQCYLDLALAGITDKGAKVVKALEDHIAFEAPMTSLSFEWPKPGEWGKGLRRWKWCDTLFMAPTVFVRMSKWTGDPKYLAFADSEFRALSDFLFSEEHGFYFRDSRFFTKKSPNGTPEFWSRGNGWVFAALAEMIEFMPKDYPHRDWYLKRYRRMAESIRKAQTKDGTWHVNLLDPSDGGNEPEMSGTCLYLYGYLWGINNGIFERKDYAETIDRAWKAVLAEVKADGRIGRMQRPASAPGTAGSDEEAPYGVGAFLATAVEMAKYLRLTL